MRKDRGIVQIMCHDMPTPAFIVEDDGHVAWGNLAFLKLAGGELEDIVGLPLSDFEEEEGSLTSPPNHSEERRQCGFRTLTGYSRFICVDTRSLNRGTLYLLCDKTAQLLARRCVDGERAIRRILSEAPTLSSALPEILEVLVTALEPELGVWWEKSGGGISFANAVSHTKRGKELSLVLQACHPSEKFQWTERSVQPRVLTLKGDATLSEQEDYASAAQRGVYSVCQLGLELGHESYGVLELYFRHLFELREPVLNLYRELIAELNRFLVKEETALLIQNQQERLSQALSAGRMGAWSWELGEVEFFECSSELEELLGIEPGAFEGTWQAINQMIHPEDSRAVRQAVQQAVVEGKECEAEFRFLHREGEERWMSFRGRPVYSRRGEPVRVSGIGIDITLQKRLQRDLEERLTQLAATDARKDEFLAILAHEIRNPLSAIYSALRLLARPEHTEWAKSVMTRQVYHLTRLVDDLLDVARITSGKIELKRKVLPLSAVFERVAAVVRPLIDEKGHSLTVRETPLALDADPTRLEQILVNLLTNAAKYTPEGGSLTIESRLEEDQVFITVTDTGIGLSEEMKYRVFDLFSQVDQSLDRAKGGLGIGLTLSRWLAELHGGKLEAESAGVGRGSVFTLVLPQRAQLSVPEEERRAEATGVREGERQVFLVDDNLDSCLLLAKILESEGFIVHTAMDGEEAVERLKKLHPDIILLDIGLPKKNGYEVAQLLREDPRFETTPIVALSGYGQSHHRLRSFQAGFDLHFLKPINTDALLEAMNSFLLPNNRCTEESAVSCEEERNRCQNWA